MKQKFINKTFHERIRKLCNYIVYDIIKMRLMRILSDKQFVMLDYLIALKKVPNFNKPTTYSEKLQWIKVYGHLEKFTKYVDKFEVRKYVGKMIGNKYLIPVLGVYKKYSEIDFQNLPEQFVIKATHGSGYNYVCKAKSKLDLKMLEKIINGWMNENFYFKTRERQYKNIEPKIIIEKYLEDSTGSLMDFKIFCFDGKPTFIYTVTDRFVDVKYNFLDLNWNMLPIKYLGYPNTDNSQDKPIKLKEMISITKRLASKFPFVRVDLYLVKNKVYFGELTFTPDNGLHKLDPPEIENNLGKMIDLGKY